MLPGDGPFRQTLKHDYIPVDTFHHGMRTLDVKRLPLEPGVNPLIPMLQAFAASKRSLSLSNYQMELKKIQLSM